MALVLDRSEFIDWTARGGTVRLEAADGPSQREESVSPAGGLWAIVPRFPGEILTADKYNADRQVMVDNATPSMIDDYSATLAQMQATTNPYPGGSPSQATNLAGEIERLRFVLKSLNPTGNWYELPTIGIAPAGGFRLPNNVPLLGQRPDGSYGALIQMGPDGNILVGSDLPAGKQIVLGTAEATGVLIPAHLDVREGLTLAKNYWIDWDGVQAIGVSSINNIILIGGAGAPYIRMDKYVYFPAGADITNLLVHGVLTVDGVIVGGGGGESGGTITLAKGEWLTWSDIPAISVGTDNRLWMGGSATEIILMKSVTMPVGTQITAPALYTTGGIGVVDGVTTVRAWGRFLSSGGFQSQYGFSNGYFLGTGPPGNTYRFVLTRPFYNGYAVAVTIESAYNAIGRVQRIDAQNFNVTVATPEGIATTADFQLIVTGQL
jgi:hypothetical protein